MPGPNLPLEVRLRNAAANNVRNPLLYDLLSEASEAVARPKNAAEVLVDGLPKCPNCGAVAARCGFCGGALR